MRNAQRDHPSTVGVRPRSAHRLRLSVHPGIVAAAAIAVTLAVVLAAATTRPERPDAAAGGVPLASTGEVNAMGMPVVGTPGAATGTVTAGGVEVRGASWDLGQVPLDVAVRPTWTLRNTGDTPVSLGEPKAEVREGCCPGPLVLGSRTLAPGAATTLSFELGMHEGMDGPHDLGVHVPVIGDGAEDHLILDVTGDFR